MGITQPDLEALQRRNVESSQRQAIAHAARPPLGLLPNQLPFGSGRFTVAEMRKGYKILHAGKE